MEAKPSTKSKTNCAVAKCSNTYANVEGPISFYGFPEINSKMSDEKKKKVNERRNAWIQFCCRENLDGSKWQPSKNARICSRHFVDNHKINAELNVSYNPTRLHPLDREVSDEKASKDISRMKRSLKRSSSKKDLVECPMKKKKPNKQRQQQQSDQSNNTLDQSEDSTTQPDLDSTDKTAEINVISIDPFIEKPFENITESVATTFVDQSVENCQCRCGQTVSDKVYSKPLMKDACVGTDDCPEDVPPKPTMKDTSVNTEISGNGPCFRGFVTALESDGIETLAAVRLPAFYLLMEMLKEENFKPRNNKVEDLLLVFLMRFKLDIPFSALSILFCISESTLRYNFESIMEILSVRTNSFVYWPTKEEIAACLPDSFKPNYSQCRVIIDCTEVRAEKPGQLEKQNMLYSHYKCMHTIKFMIAIAPNGMITFVSKAYGGHTSDTHITNHSGFLKKLQPGDWVMADKGFPQIDSKDVITIIPPRATSNVQFSEEEMALTHDIGTIRIHVERIIQRLKVFRILRNSFPTSLFPFADKIIHLCAALVNLHYPVLKVTQSQVDELLEAETKEETLPQNVDLETLFDLLRS